jgi:hypothetical protein
MRLARVIVSGMAPEQPVLTPLQRRHVIDDVTSFVDRSLRVAPVFIRLPAFIGGSFLAAIFLCAIACGKREKTVPERCSAWLALAERYAGMPLKSLTRLYRSLVVLAFFEHDIVLRLLDEATLAERTNASRQEYARVTARVPSPNP